jgi:hypothetical protein
MRPGALVAEALKTTWSARMDKRGFKGRALFDSAKALTGKHGKV